MLHAPPTPSAIRSHIAANSPVKLTPPAGWTPETIPTSNYPGRKAIYQWLNYSRGDEEYVELSQRYFPDMSTSDFARFYEAYLRATQIVVYTDHPIALCGNQQGWYVKHSMGPYSNDVGEDVFIAADGYVYVARYIYQAKWSPLPLGEASIRSLCLRTAPRPVVAHLPVRFSPPPGWATTPFTKRSAPYPGVIALYSDVHAYPPKHAIWISEQSVDGDDASDDTSAGAKKAAAVNAKMHPAIKDLATIEINACGTRAWYQTFSETEQGVTVRAEQVILDGPVSYVATYMRRPTEPESPQARAALNSFCPLSTPTPTTSPTPSATAPLSTQSPTPTPAAAQRPRV